MIRSLEAQVSEVTGADESMSLSRCDPLLWLVTMRDPPLPSSNAMATYLPFGEKAAALGDCAAIAVGVPELVNSTNPPGTSGVAGATPSGVTVGLGDGVAAVAVGV